MSDLYDDNPCPCDTCTSHDFCDGWDARFCCALCQWHGGADCEDCDPMDIQEV